MNYCHLQKRSYSHLFPRSCGGILHISGVVENGILLKFINTKYYTKMGFLSSLGEKMTVFLS